MFAAVWTKLRYAILPGIALLVLLSLIALGFRSPKSSTELVGTYVLDSELIHEDLVLHAGGAFTQSIRIKATGEVIGSQGTWKYPAVIVGDESTYNEVILDNRIRVLEWPDALYSDYARQPPGRSVFGASYWFGSLFIGSGADSWPEYKKVK